MSADDRLAIVLALEIAMLAMLVVLLTERGHTEKYHDKPSFSKFPLRITNLHASNTYTDTHAQHNNKGREKKQKKLRAAAHPFDVVSVRCTSEVCKNHFLLMIHLKETAFDVPSIHFTTLEAVQQHANK